MPRSHWLHAPHAIFTALLFFGVSAQAKPEYSDTIPNYGVNSCDTCHPPGDQGSENTFGLDIAPLVGTAEAGWWPVVRDLDSDGDGQSNAQELGDPCATWSKGKTPDRADGISNPGDPGDLSPTPDVPDCGTGSTTSAGAGGGEDPGATSGATTTGGEGAAGPGTTYSTGPGMAKPPPPQQYGACSASAMDASPLALAAVLAALALTARRR
jgi:hypothetical protein